MEHKILHNQMTTPDGTVLVSKKRHDFVSHTDANGNFYFLDGGHEYVRCTNNGDEELLTLTTEDEHSLLREHVLWGTRGPKLNLPLTYKKIKDLDDEHLVNILKYVNRDVRIISDEIAFRAEKDSK